MTDQTIKQAIDEVRVLIAKGMPRIEGHDVNIVVTLITSLLSMNKIAVEALEFYGGETTYELQEDRDGRITEDAPIDNDLGERAREALKQLSLDNKLNGDNI